jgi:methylglutaconyl-CoA hydratase
MVQSASLGTITTTIENNIATVSFGHPASNSFPRQLLDSLTQEFHELSSNCAVHIIVLRSDGDGAFCAGASFDELLQVSNWEQGVHFFSGFAHLINAMRNCSKIIIGRIHGKAVGGGVGIAAACDYTFATANASIKLSELAIGIGPFVIEPVVSRKIGKTAMTQMALEAHQWQTAEWAATKGLYTQMAASTQEMDVAIANYATRLANYHLAALTEMKKVIWEGTEHWSTLLIERAGVTGQLVLSDYAKNALAQFKKK